MDFWLNCCLTGVVCATWRRHSVSIKLLIYRFRNIKFYILVFIGTLQHGSCVIQPTRIGFSSEELIDMIGRCGLNRLNQFTPFLSVHFRNARQDSKLLSMLLSLDEILYSGLPLSQEDEQWALKIGINLRVSPCSNIITLYFLKIDNFVRIYLVAQKSEACYSPVGTTKTLPYSKLFPAPHISSSRSTRL